MSEHIHTHRSRISRVSEPAHFQSIFLHGTRRFPEYLRQWRVSIYLYIQQQDFPSIWAIWSSEYIFAYSRRMSRVSEPVECQDILINTAAGFPEYLSQMIFRIYLRVQQQDFPSIWASTLSKHIPAYHRRQIPRVSEPVECQSIFLHMQGGFPEYLSQWSVRVY